MNIYCLNPCLFATALIGASIATSVASLGNSKSQQLMNAFTTDEQKQMYYLVKKERLSLYSMSHFISVVLALFYALAITQRNIKINYCIFALIIQFFTVFIYMFYPKNYSLKEYLKTEEQHRIYKEIGTYMRNSYLLGLAIGIGLYFCLGPKC